MSLIVRKMLVVGWLPRVTMLYRLPCVSLKTTVIRVHAHQVFIWKSMTKIMVRTYVVVRHSGQNWYWGILKRRLLGVQLARPQTSGQREEKSVALTWLWQHISLIKKKMAYNVAIKSSETAIRECLCRSKAFMRASVLTGLKWQYLFVKAVFCE